MNIELRRIRHRPETIDGQIYIDGTKICDTAENACHCLPEGNYPVAIIKCKQHGRKMPVIQLMNNSWEIHGDSCSKEKPCDSCKKLDCVGINTNMPCYCPQLCPGNGVYKRTDGAIILGTYIITGCLKHPKEAFDSLYDRIRKSAERGHAINLIISSI